MQDNQVEATPNEGSSRRRFLQAAAVTGVAGAVWAEPIIRGIPAYAADASSIVGQGAGYQITWSTMRANWEDDTEGAIMQTSVSGPVQMGNVCGVNSTWVATLTNMATVTITASMGPGSGLACNPTNGPSTISLEPQTGCIFTNVTVTDGMVDMTSGNTIMWTAADDGMIDFMFSIMCG